MENPSHSLRQNKLSRISSHANAAAKGTYDDVFGGPPKFGVPPTLSPRAEDYREIFGGFHAPRVSSIPVLDLPVVDKKEVYFDVRSPGLDYSEVFGGFQGLDFADGCEELFDLPRGGSAGCGSSDEAWTPAASESPSEEELDHSGSNQCLSNGDSHHMFYKNIQYNISYHKANPRRHVEITNGLRRTGEIYTVPGYSYMVDRVKEKRLKKTRSDNSNGRNDVIRQRDYGRINSCPSETFVTVSEVGLRTEPSHLPPPSRPPPAASTGDTNGPVSRGKTGYVEGNGDDYCTSPPFFDMEVDGSSSAAAVASAAAMKEAVMKAQAQFRSAKELMERKEGRQNLGRMVSTGELRDMGGKHLNEEIVQGMNQGQSSEMKFFTREEPRDVMVMKCAVQDSLEGEKLQNQLKKRFANKMQGKELASNEMFGSSQEAGHSKEATHFFELVKADRSGAVLAQTKGENLSEHVGICDHGDKEGMLGGFEGQESFNKMKATVDRRVPKENFVVDVKNMSPKAVKEVSAENNTDKNKNAGQNTTQEEEAKKTRRKKHCDKKAVVKLNGSESSDDHESLNDVLIEVAHEFEARQVMEHKTDGPKLKTFRRMEVEEFVTEDHGKTCKEKRPKEPFESEEKEGRPVSVIESMGNEKTPPELSRQDDKKNRRMENLESAWDDTSEREENEWRLKKAFELEENEKRMREVLEQEERSKSKEDQEREENERRLKENLVLKENRRKQKAAAREEQERKLNKALGCEGNENRLREAIENAEREKLEEALEREEIEKKLREPCEQEEERRRKEAFEKEEKKILKEALEKEEKEKMLKEAVEQEECEKRLNEAHEKEQMRKRLEEAQEMEANEGRLSDAHNRELTEERLPEAKEREKSENGCQEASQDEDDGSNSQCSCTDDRKSSRDESNYDQGEIDDASRDTFELEELDKWLKESIDVEEADVLNEAAKKVDCMKNDTKNVKSDFPGSGSKQILESRGVIDASNDNSHQIRTEPQGSGNKFPATENKEESETVDSVESPPLVDRPMQSNPETPKVFSQMSNKLRHQEEKCSAREWGEMEENINRPEPSFGADGKKVETQPPVLNAQGTSQQSQDASQETAKAQVKETGRIRREQERLRKIEEEREREREREKDRMAVDRATLEARERAYAEARERADRTTVERAAAEARQRSLAEARERLEKACAEAREQSFLDKTSNEARIRAERAAVDRAIAEARERAASRYNGMRQTSLPSDLREWQHQTAGSSINKRYEYSSGYGGPYNMVKSEGVEGESAQRCRARLERHRRTAERAAKALAEKNMQDLLAQREQAERNRLAEILDADVKRWSSGKEGNLRALLSTLQYILGPDSGWQPIPLTEVITSAAVKKAYRKATLCVHPDKLQQRGASIQQKYTCEKVFDLLKEAWNKFNSEER